MSSIVLIFFSYSGPSGILGSEGIARKAEYHLSWCYGASMVALSVFPDYSKSFVEWILCKNGFLYYFRSEINVGGRHREPMVLFYHKLLLMTLLIENCLRMIMISSCSLIGRYLSELTIYL